MIANEVEDRGLRKVETQEGTPDLLEKQWDALTKNLALPLMTKSHIGGIEKNKLHYCVFRLKETVVDGLLRTLVL